MLELVTGRVEAPVVLDLLGLEPVRERFGIEAEQLPQIAAWIRASGARWGVDQAHRARVAQPRDKGNTWRFGLERLLLGVTMADDGRRFAGILPVDHLEGGDTWLLGRVVDFVATLFGELEALRKARRPGAWADSLALTLDRLTATTPKAAWLTRRVRATLDELRSHAELAGGERPITVEALRAALTGRFEVASGGSREQTGAVTFCAMVPMRSIPLRA